MAFKLGKSAVRRDVRTYRLKSALTVHLSDVSAGSEWSTGTIPSQMWVNGRFGYYTFVSYADLTAIWTKVIPGIGRLAKSRRLRTCQNSLCISRIFTNSENFDVLLAKVRAV